MTVILATASLAEEGKARLRALGELRYQPIAETKSMLGGSRLVKALDGVDVFISEAENLKVREIQGLSTLQIIVSCRGNPVNIDIPAATAKGIPVLHAPGRNAEGVAELAITLMLMLSRNIPQAMGILRRPERSMTMLASIYFDLRGREIWRQTAGLVGLGAVGRAVAARLKAFEARVIAYDPFVREDVMAEYGVEKVDLDTLMRESDFVSLHVLPSASTKGLVGEREIGLMKKTAYFINTARSSVTDEKALYQALCEKRIAGAGLDVYDVEPLPVDSPLLTLDNVILLPHIGGATEQVTVHQTEIVLPDLERLIRGERPHHIVNAEVLERFQFRR